MFGILILRVPTEARTEQRGGRWDVLIGVPCPCGCKAGAWKRVRTFWGAV